MSDAPTYPPLLPALGRRGMWWWEPADYDASPDGIARLQSLGVSWVVCRSAVSTRGRGGLKVVVDGDYQRFVDQQDGIDRLNAAGILVATFIYTSSDTGAIVDQEVQAICRNQHEGAAFVALDMEEHYEEQGGDIRAMSLAAAIGAQVDPTFPLVDCPWAWIAAHPRFVPTLRAMAPRMSAHFPQLYTTAFGFSHAATAFDHYDRDWRAEMSARPSYLQRPLQPIFSIFDRTTPYQPPGYGLLDPEDIGAFERRYGVLPLSYWSLHTATPGALDYLRGNGAPTNDRQTTTEPAPPLDAGALTPRGEMEAAAPVPSLGHNTHSETPRAKREEDDHGPGAGGRDDDE